MDCRGSLAGGVPRRCPNPLAAGLDVSGAALIDARNPAQTAAYAPIFTSASHKSLVLIT
jgi:hypothetical protein